MLGPAQHSSAGGSTSVPVTGLSLQKRAWLITFGVLIALAALLAIGTDRVFRQQADELERQFVQQSVRRLQSAQNVELDQLERSARDYATWTDTYEFITDPSRPYADSNLTAATFANLQLDAFLLFNRGGDLVLGRSYHDGTVSADDTADLARLMKPHASRVSAGDGTVVKGLLKVEKGGLALFALLPILKDDGSGPARGALAQVRMLSATKVAQLKNAIDQELELRGSEAISEGSKPVVAGMGAAFTTEIIRDDLLQVRLPVADVNGEASGFWQLALPRDIHVQGLRARAVFYVVIGVLIVASAALIGWMLRVMVIARLEALNDAVKQVGATADLSLRLPLQGADELTSLTAGVNQMLESLERGEASRAASEREREGLRGQLQEAQKLEALGTLTGGLAHDFNNLLTSIQGSATLLRLDATDRTGDAHLQRIELATAQAAKLVRQMMAFGRRAPTVFAPVHLTMFVRDGLHALRPSIPPRIEFHFQNEAAEDLVNADAAQLNQVLANLVTNAVHAMPDGPGSLTIKLTDVPLPDSARAETAALPRGRYLRLTVSDTGTGMAEDVVPRIFEPFFTTKPVGAGTGLGLAVVHGIVTHHHGSIGVHSQLGHGTTFVIHLPKLIGRVAAAPANGRPIARPPRGSSRNILLVDDDALVRETLEAGLRSKQYGITCAESGAQALKLIREQRGAFDAVITDQMMPGMTGVELGEIVALENPGLPLILVTGFASALNEPKVKAMGFSAMLMKPVSIEQLDAAVQSAQTRV